MDIQLCGNVPLMLLEIACIDVKVDKEDHSSGILPEIWLFEKSKSFTFGNDPHSGGKVPET